MENYVKRGKCGGTHHQPPPNSLLARGVLGLNKKLKRRRNWTTIFYGIIISPHMNERLKNLKFCRDLALMPGKRHVQPAIQLCDNSLSSNSKQTTFHLWILNEVPKQCRQLYLVLDDDH